MNTLKIQRYEIDSEIEYGRGIYDGYEYHNIVYKPHPKGDWVKADPLLKHIERLQKRINRMQERLDKHEGRW